SRRTVAPTVTVKVVGIGERAGRSYGDEVRDLRRDAGLTVKAAFGVEAPMHPVERPFRGQVHLRALRYGSESDRDGLRMSSWHEGAIYQHHEYQTGSGNLLRHKLHTLRVWTIRQMPNDSDLWGLPMNYCPR